MHAIQGCGINLTGCETAIALCSVKVYNIMYSQILPILQLFSIDTWELWLNLFPDQLTYNYRQLLLVAPIREFTPCTNQGS